MTTAVGGAGRAPRPSSLADVLDLVLDKGVVIDAYARLSLVGIEVLTLDARIVVASVDTYLRYAEAVNRLDLYPGSQPEGVPQLLLGAEREVGEAAAERALRKPKQAAVRAARKAGQVEEKAEGKFAGAVEGAKEKVGRAREKTREKISDTRERVTGGDDEPGQGGDDEPGRGGDG